VVFVLGGGVFFVIVRKVLFGFWVCGVVSLLWCWGGRFGVFGVLLRFVGCCSGWVVVGFWLGGVGVLR